MIPDRHTVCRSLTTAISGHGIGMLPGGRTAYQLLQRFTPDEQTTVTYDGGDVTIMPSRSPAERALYWRGEYEPSVRRVIHRQLDSGDVAIDVGAHVGHHTVSMRDAVGPTGVVVAIEPHPERAEILRETVGEYPNVIVCECALSDANATDGRLSGDIPSLSDAGHGNVTLTTLDSLIELLGLERIGLVKIDVEGHEQRVVDGLDEYRDRVRSLIVEMHESDGRYHRLWTGRGSDQ